MKTLGWQKGWGFFLQTLHHISNHLLKKAGNWRAFQFFFLAIEFREAVAELMDKEISAGPGKLTAELISDYFALKMHSGPFL